ncbi:VanZ family protein [Roseovarius sp. LXJ103]|uniref:VanZ family protein n=1 Tax=Roseovarius carneus TaxID=2853164 RepID=UPI000D61385A|nr:VanZ family protein [Roseovarius carneus]MBZ8117794.1 VanZ family protein [Roseovarius carneus]PWE36437.1 VanZ family protein [Pelagicola sp. LXJ1103]
MPRVARLGLASCLTVLVILLILRFTLSVPSGGAPLPINDKLAHAIAFALLTLPLSWALPARWAFIVAVAVVFGAGIELVQPAFGRAREGLDLLADVVGAFAGAVAGVLLARLKRG